jgi:hypothetical protein
MRANRRCVAALAWATATAFGISAMSSVAFAQAATGKMTGKLTDAESAQPISDAVITATSPSAQGEQTVVSDASGEFEIPSLPPGVYLLHIEKENYKPFNQGDIVIRLDKTIRVTLKMVPEAFVGPETVVVGKPPTVDIGSTQTGATITSDFLNNIPIASPNAVGGAVRSFESLAATTPGSHEDLYGVSIGGTTSPENNYVIDGVNTTDPSVGLTGTPLSIDFVQEANIITGGYMPEYGRATGGVENVITKSGGNEFHGDFGLYVTPGFLTADQKQVIEQGSALTAQSKVNLNANLHADVGGYIIKDKLWFYVGLEPTIINTDITRRIAAVSYQQGCPVDAKGALITETAEDPDGSHDPNFSRFDVNTTGCTVKGNASDISGSPIVDKTVPIAGTATTEHDNNFQYQYIAKLTFLLNQDQRFTASVFGNPGTRDGIAAANGDYSSEAFHLAFNNQDYALTWDGSFLDKHILVNATLGWHRQVSDTTPQDPASALIPGIQWNHTHSLVDFMPDAAQYCGAGDPGHDTLNGGDGFYKCPVTGYNTGGPGFNFIIDHTVLDNWQGRLAVTNLFRAAGHHEVKYGIDYELEQFNHRQAYSGGVVIDESVTGHSFNDFRRFGYLQGPDDPVFNNTVQNLTKSTSVAGFVQDSYRVLDLFTVNGGVRWEDQQLIGGDGATVISLPENIMPRVGVIYDWTGKGSSKIYADYGWFYESLPITMLDVNFPNQTTIFALRDKNACNPHDVSQLVGVCQQPASLRSDPVKDPVETNQVWSQQGAPGEPVDANLKGQYTEEIQAGAEYEIIPDGRLGLTYTHRDLARVIEDMSNDNANTYFIGNPGQGIASNFPKPQRDYDAGSVYFSKTFSHHWMFTGSYTLSRLYGNIAGLFRPEDGQLSPNINSTFDLVRLLANQTGRLPDDHTHNIKLYGAYDLPIGGNSSVTVGMAYTALSGGPIDYLGGDLIYGPGQAFVLPRGSGPSLPWVHEVDSSLKFNYRFTDSQILTVGVDIFNLLDLRQVTAVDENYTLDDVLPIVNGKPSDLANLKSTVNVIPDPNDPTGQKTIPAPAIKNPTYGQPTAYQPPLTTRLSIKMTF